MTERLRALMEKAYADRNQPAAWDDGAFIATSLAEGLVDDDAIIHRAIALAHADRAASNLAKAAIDAQDIALHAARVHRQAAQLECRAHGKSETID